MARAERTLVLAAVERELEALRALVPASLAARITYRVAGVGKAAAAAAAARELALCPAGLVLLVGCAGAYPGAALVPGDVVIADEEVFADEGVDAPQGFLDLATLALPAARRGDELLHNLVPAARLPPAARHAIAMRAGDRFRVVSGRLATVSTASGTDARARVLEERWRPLAESMEGAAVALACWLAGCEFVEIRGISNPVGDRDRARWQLDEACRHAAEVAAAYLAWRRGETP